MDCSGGLIGCGNAAGYSNIDAAPFVDPATGTGYLYLSTGHEASGAWHRTVSVIPLAADLLHAAGPREPLFSVTQPWEGNVVEGPSMVHHGAGYHPPSTPAAASPTPPTLWATRSGRRRPGR